MSGYPGCRQPEETYAQWFSVVYFGIREQLHKATWEEAGPDYLTGITTTILAGVLRNQSLINTKVNLG